MDDSSQLTTVRIADDGTLIIPSSACESAGIEPPTSVFLDTEEDQIRIVAEVAGVEVDEHDPEAAVQHARKARRDPDAPPTLDEIFEGIAENDPYNDDEDIREFLLGE
jgi:bifunctional DNA-binding transcriptional regulator/antitoxin component of YhaV-PrlF toxin-antitoxin module